MKSSTYEIVEVFYAENERQYRVIEKKPDGEIQDVARLTSREKAQYYIDARTQQEDPRHNQW
tara:strand:+ start:829 stop:1014 length:186 start_codon:yes stop_codon:yes gene_type:complete